MDATRAGSRVKHALIVAAVFLAMPAIGTVTHELGHIGVAYVVGATPVLHYGSMHVVETSEIIRELQRLALGEEPEHWDAAAQNVVGMDHAAWQELMFWVTVGGPAQTAMTGMIGALWLWWLRRRRDPQAMWTLTEWTAALLALFWSREVFILAQTVYAATRGYSVGGDESGISLTMGWPYWTVAAVLGSIGLAVCCLVVFVWHPARGRWTLITLGTAMSLVGFYIWMKWLGPIVLP